MTLNSIISQLKSNKYQIYTRPFELNIVGVRSNTVRSEQFDDELHVFYKNNYDQWIYHHYQVTTDPSVYYIDNPVVPSGYGFIKAGQWVNAYRNGYHKGRPALVQQKPITVIRNYDLKGMFKSISGSEETGIFGNNIHDMKGNMLNASAGCVVFADNVAYQEFLQLANSHEKLFSNNFTLTILDHRDKRNLVRTGVAAALLFGGGILATTTQLWKR